MEFFSGVVAGMLFTLLALLPKFFLLKDALHRLLQAVIAHHMETGDGRFVARLTRVLNEKQNPGMSVHTPLDHSDLKHATDALLAALLERQHAALVSVVTGLVAVAAPMVGCPGGWADDGRCTRCGWVLPEHAQGDSPHRP